MATGVRITVGQQPVQVDPGPGLRVWQYPTKPVQPITNVSETAQAAVADPVGFPALSLAVVDGDRVVITADADIPRLSDILFGLAQSLRPHNVNLSVLLGESAQGELLHVLKQRLGDAVEIVVHDPDDAGQLGYLAATEKADPIYLNRRLLDADFVLPVMLARMSSSMDTDPLSGHIFPQFADRVSQRRVRTDALLSPTAESPEPSEVAWLLGLQLMVGVVPASGDQLAAIIAGTQETIGKALAEPVQKVYRFDRPATEPAGAPDLVVACVDGNSQQQTWENIARAVSAGLRMVKPGGLSPSAVR